MTVIYNGAGEFSLRFDNKVVELTTIEILKVQNYNFDTQTPTESVGELEEIIEGLNFKLEEFKDFGKIDAEKIKDLEEEIEDLKAEIGY
jgi:DNA-directed RNA polymerase subunit F